MNKVLLFCKQKCPINQYLWGIFLSSFYRVSTQPQRLRFYRGYFIFNADAAFGISYFVGYFRIWLNGMKIFIFGFPNTTVGFYVHYFYPHFIERIIGWIVYADL